MKILQNFFRGFEKMNKSYRKGYAFQRRVKKYLEKQGFECIIRPRSQFPDITAYCKLGAKIEANIFYNNGKDSIKSMIDPFIIFDIECKVNKYLTKEEKEKALKRISDGKCNAFFVAYRKNRKLHFDGIIPELKFKIKNEGHSKYIG